MTKNAESQRLEEAREPQSPWKKWGPYLSERQWGTVREDYSHNGNAWDYFTHDQARSRAYHWGEDGLAGISDDWQRLCFALALWNGKDPIIKERLFGLTNAEGNHGEDVKEYYFYLDSTPTHSYMKYLYKYPQAAYPYDEIVDTNRARSRIELEYELLDTGVFDENRYFDVFVEYAKESPEDILVQITVHNRGPEAADLHVLPTLWFRNRWSWGRDNPRPVLEQVAGKTGVVRGGRERAAASAISIATAEASLLFTENETNTQRLVGVPNRTPFVKDGINNYLVHGQRDAVNPQQTGTKVAAHYRLTVPPGKSEVVRLRLTPVAPNALSESYGKGSGALGKHFDEVMRGAPERGGRVLRVRDSGVARVRTPPASCARPWPGCSGRKQFYHLRCEPLARGARQRSLHGRPQGGAAQRAVASHVQRRRHLDAGQVGVSLVRGVGPRLPRLAADAGGPRFRQAAAGADAARALHASERPDSGLRVELRRRQSAGARLGDDLHLSAWRKRARAKATSTGSSAASRSCC